LGIVILAAGLVGCQTGARLRLEQSRISGPEASMGLRPSRVAWSPGDGVERVLAEFPLPGSSQGDPIYLLYIRIAVSEPGEPIIDIGRRPIRGFLIQTQGQYQGREDINGGQLALSGHSMSADASRRLELNLTCEFGSRIRGTLKARRDDAVLEEFETQRRAGDVKDLVDAPAVAGNTAGEEP
jgi:hypothetical protein